MQPPGILSVRCMLYLFEHNGWRCDAGRNRPARKGTSEAETFDVADGQIDSDRDAQGIASRMLRPLLRLAVAEPHAHPPRSGSGFLNRDSLFGGTQPLVVGDV